MIRQLEIPWQARSLVILDVRAEAYSNPSAFEAAVSGAASVIHHLMNNAFDTQVWMGGPTVTVSTGSGYAVAMERLAQVKTQEGLELAAAECW
jgi:ribose 5-phosphate isomerase